MTESSIVAGAADCLARLRERAARFARLNMTGLAGELYDLADELEESLTAPGGA